MKTLDGHGDDYRNAQLTILLEVRMRWIRMSFMTFFDILY